MPITLNTPRASSFAGTDFIELISYVIDTAEPISASTTTVEFVGNYGGQPLSATINGSGFGQSIIDGDAWVTQGIVDTLSITVGGETLTMTDMDIDMAVFHPINYADQNGSNPLGIENYFLARDWVLNFSDQDDVLRPTLVVGDGANFNLRGDDIVRTFGGDDFYYAGSGDDRVFGGSGNDTLLGGNGRDLIYGNSGSDVVRGDAGADRLFGDGGADTVNGGSGNDILSGGIGFDRLIGGTGIDDFVFEDGDNTNILLDFDAFDHREDIDLAGVTAITDYNDLVSNHMDQVNANVVITDGAGLRVIIRNTDINDLDQGDFLF